MISTYIKKLRQTLDRLDKADGVFFSLVCFPSLHRLELLPKTLGALAVYDTERTLHDQFEGVNVFDIYWYPLLLNSLCRYRGILIIIRNGCDELLLIFYGGLFIRTHLVPNVIRCFLHGSSVIISTVAAGVKNDTVQAITPDGELRRLMQ